VRSRIRGSRVVMTGVLDADELDRQLRRCALALVSQRGDVAEFNLPSKLMNYMAYGAPVIASVRPDSETAAIVRDAGAGWVTDAADPDQFAATAARVLSDPAALQRAGDAGRAFARRNFQPQAVAARFEQVLESVINRR
jgi:colanic acid biosynthesis glycosyl transferase WcaI